VDVIDEQQRRAADKAPAHYSYKPSLMAGAYRFDVTEAGLAWQQGARSGLWRYRDIVEVRLSFRPVWLQSRRYRADIRHSSGARIPVLSTTWQTAALVAAQDDAYRDFIVALHQRLTEGQTRLRAGVPQLAYATGLVLLALLAIAMAGLLTRAVAVGEYPGALFIIGFALLFAWQLGGFMRRNRPRPYALERLPRSVLPAPPA